MRRPRAPTLRVRASCATARAASSLKVTLTPSYSKSLAYCLRMALLGLGEDFDQRGFVELIEDAEDRQAPDELRDEAVLEQVLRLGLAQQLGVALSADGRDSAPSGWRSDRRRS